MATAAKERLRNYLEAFHTIGADAARQPAWLRGLRERGFARFCEIGFPTTKDEDWRFTNVNAISKTPFQLTRDANATIQPSGLQPFLIPGAACRLVFVNGRFAHALSDLPSPPAGIKIGSLSEALARDSSTIEPHM